MPEAQIKTGPKLKVIGEQEIPDLLLPGEVGAVLELIVRNKDGKIVEQRTLKSKSFVRQFLELLWIQAFQLPEIAPYSLRDTSNTLRDICESRLTFACDAGEGVTTLGIIIGSGTTAPTIDDYAIETLIAHGTSSNQLQYSTVTFGAPSSSATISQFTITRNFANASGDNVAVYEIALYVKAYKYTDTYYFMTIRDTISGGINVPNGDTLTINYRPQVAI